MGRLHPGDFPIGSLRESESRVVEALVEYLDDQWVVMPTVRLGASPPIEIDVVIAHRDHGVGIIEVKGYLPRIVAGRWVEPYETEGGGPIAQLHRNRQGLRDHLRSVVVGAQFLHVDAGLAFPNASGVAGGVEPIDIDADDLIWSSDIIAIDSAVARIVKRGREGRPMFDRETFDAIVRAIRPDVEFESDPGAYGAWASGRLETWSANQTRSAERLDLNRRVYVTGGAGTGKSRLALAWTRRASIRGDRTLLVCFNEPLGAEFQRRVGDMEGVRTGPFLRLALELEGIPHKEVPDGADSDFWNNEVLGHLHLHWPNVTEQFDTIVVDEVQDFSPAWLAMLEALLDPDGPRRLLLTGDVEQSVHHRGFVAPRPEDGWTLCELVANSRNSRDIARLIRSRLGGPPSPAALPPSTHLRFVDVPADETALVELVVAEIGRLREDGFDDEQIAVVALDHDARDELRIDPMFVRWEERGPGLLVCETARRLKGLEFPVVILVARRWPVDDLVLYVGVSRAVLGLTVIGPPALGERLALT